MSPTPERMIRKVSNVSGKERLRRDREILHNSLKRVTYLNFIQLQGFIHDHLRDVSLADTGVCLHTS
jgi:hypothetical protein